MTQRHVPIGGIPVVLDIVVSRIFIGVVEKRHNKLEAIIDIVYEEKYRKVIGRLLNAIKRNKNVPQVHITDTEVTIIFTCLPAPKTLNRAMEVPVNASTKVLFIAQADLPEDCISIFKKVYAQTGSYRLSHTSGDRPDQATFWQMKLTDVVEAPFTNIRALL